MRCIGIERKNLNARKIRGRPEAPLRPLKTRQKNSDVFQADTFGVLKLELYSNRYTWEFLPVGNGSALDAGTGSCVLPQRIINSSNFLKNALPQFKNTGSRLLNNLLES
jgi:hypothetical protein